MSKVVAVLGVGPGIGHAVALRFARENFAVALMARSPEKLEAVASEIKQLNVGAPACFASPPTVIHSHSNKQNAASTLTIATDARDPDSIKLAFETIHKQLGPVNVSIHLLFLLLLLSNPHAMW